MKLGFVGSIGALIFALALPLRIAQESFSPAAWIRSSTRRSAARAPDSKLRFFVSLRSVLCNPFFDRGTNPW